MLSAINSTIDTVSGIKSQFVKTCVKNEEIQKQLQTYIDAQQAFAKNVAKSSVDFYTALGMSASSFDAKKAFATK